MRLINFNSNITIYLAEPRWDSCALNMVRKVLLVCNLRGHGISLNLSNDKQIKYFNNRWKGKNKPTNVLSFSSKKNHVKHFVKSTNELHIGDIVLSMERIFKESIIEKKSFNNHFLHILIHGILHILGYDHVSYLQGKEMEKVEIKILSKLGVKDPYV